MILITLIKRFLGDESGATMVEYGILVAILSIAVAVTVFYLGGEIEAVFNVIVTCIDGPSSTSCQLQ